MESGAPTGFTYETVGGFTLTVDGVEVLVAAPGAEGRVELTLSPGLHTIEMLVEHDPLIATSPTARHDDDLKLSVDWGDGTQDLFDHVRTTPIS